MSKYQVRTYTCDRHSWTLESSAPIMPASLRVWCPLCKDEMFAKHMTEPKCKVEWRERKLSDDEET